MTVIQGGAAARWDCPGLVVLPHFAWGQEATSDG